MNSLNADESELHQHFIDDSFEKEDLYLEKIDQLHPIFVTTESGHSENLITLVPLRASTIEDDDHFPKSITDTTY